MTNFGPKCRFFGKLVPNPICVLNVKLLASTVAKIRRGPKCFGCSPSAAPSNFGSIRCFLASYTPYLSGVKKL